jgi:hypothetical protein
VVARKARHQDTAFLAGSGMDANTGEIIAAELTTNDVDDA